MIDFRFVHARTLLKVSSMAPIRGFSPPSIIIVGEKLNQADEIILNGISTKTFSIQSSTRLVAQIPPSQVGRAVSSLQILSTVPSLTGSAQLNFNASRPSKVEGIDRLVQSFIILVLSNPGSDLFEPGSGGGVLGLVGRSTDANGKSVAADLSLAIERTKSELLRLQGADQRIPPSERLLSATMVNVNFNPSSTVLSAVVELTNSLGQSAQVQLSG